MTRAAGCATGFGAAYRAGLPDAAVALYLPESAPVRDKLVKQDHQVSNTFTGTLFKAGGFSLQGNRKTLEGSGHSDRDAQFAYIARSTAVALARTSR